MITGYGKETHNIITPDATTHKCRTLAPQKLTAFSLYTPNPTELVQTLQRMLYEPLAILIPIPAAAPASAPAQISIPTTHFALRTTHSHFSLSRGSGVVDKVIVTFRLRSRLLA